MITKIKHMHKKTFLILLLCLTITAVSLILGFTWSRSKQTASTPPIPKKTEEAPTSQTPQETLKEIINKNIKQEFLPPTYKITDKPEDIELPFRDSADYFFTQWDTESTRFVTCLGYNKVAPKELMGYEILIFVKDPDLTATKLANKFLNSLPTENWKREGPHNQGWYEVETSSVISTTNHNKIYTSITFLNFFKSVMVPYFASILRRMGMIAYVVCMPNNPYYSKFEDLQKPSSEFLHP